MPHPRILQALGMTPREWGQLPPENMSSERNDLKKKAVAIIREQDKETASKGLHARIEALEARVSALENRGAYTPPTPPTPPTPTEGGA